MRSVLNDGFNYAAPAKSWAKLHEMLEELKSENQQLEQMVIAACARISKLENKVKGREIATL